MKTEIDLFDIIEKSSFENQKELFNFLNNFLKINSHCGNKYIYNHKKKSFVQRVVELKIGNLKTVESYGNKN